jgi:hypothetical protein
MRGPDICDLVLHLSAYCPLKIFHDVSGSGDGN